VVQTAARAVAACLIAAGLCGIAWAAYPETLDVSTDVVGNPIFADFNPTPYTVHYLLATAAFPALAIGLFCVLDRLARRRGRPALAPLALPAAEPGAEPERTTAAPALAYARLGAVGALAAATVAIAVDAGSEWLLTILVPVTVAYTVIARGAAGLLAARSEARAGEALSAVNAVAGALGLLAFAAAADASEVIEGFGAAVAHPLAAPWLLALVAVLAATAVAFAIARLDPARWPVAERLVLLCLVVPTAVFLLVARMPGDLGPPDLFHEGEKLTAGTLVAAGDFPWRDLLFPHGLLADVVLPQLDLASLGDSRWGINNGESIVEGPLFWVSTLLLCAYLFRRNWIFLLTTLLLLAFGWFDTVLNTRMVLAPLCLLALAALLARPSRPRAIALMALTLWQAIVVPEATVISAPIWAVVVAYDAVHRRAGAPPWARTIRCALAGAAILGVFVVYLAANDALGGFADYYATFVGGHVLTGGLEITGTGFEFWAWVVIPIAVALAAWAYAAFGVLSGRWFSRSDWVVGAAVVGLIAYYLKFLARPDTGHLDQVAAVAVVPALYVVYRVVGWLDERARRSGGSALAWRPASAALAVCAVVLAPGAPLDTLEELPVRMVASAHAAPENDRLGYASEGALPADLIPRAQRIVDAYGGDVFDFTNSPALFGYLVDADPATRFYHVSMAIRAETQRTLISELEQERPPLVVFSSREHGVYSWDGIVNPVRHYLVADYLLDHYRPATTVGDYVFMVRDGVPLDPATSDRAPREDLLFEGAACDWGYAPEFLDQRPESGAEAVDVPLRPAGAGYVVAARGWAADVAAGRPATEVLIVRGRRIVGAIPIGVRRDDVAAANGNPDLAASGFAASRIALGAGRDPEQPIRLFGLSPSGVASEIGDPAAGAPALESLAGPGGERIDVEPGVVTGALELLQAAPQERSLLELPAQASDYTWLELTSDAPLPEDFYTVVDERSGAGRAVTFRTLAGRSDSVLVRVGSCPQWRGFGAGRVYLGVSVGAPLTARLFR